MNDNLNNKEEFDFRKEFENQRKELAHAQRISQSYHGANELPANGGNSYQRKQFKIKFIHIILFGVIVIVGVYFYNYYTANKEHIYEGGANIKSLYDKSNYIKYLNNELYGYIDHEGNIKIEAKYKEASDFYNGYAIVSDGVKKEVININGQHMHDVLNETDGYNLNYDYWYIGKTLFSGQMLKIQDDAKKVANHDKYFYYYNRELDKTIIIDYIGTIIYETQGRDVFLDIKSGSYTDELIYIKNSNKHLIINPYSKKVIFESDEEFTLLDNGIYKSDRFYYIHDDETIYPYTALNVTLVDKKNKILKIEESAEVSYYFDVLKNSKLENYNMSNLDIVASQFNYDIVHCDKENNYYSLMEEGKTLLECKYDKIEFLNDELHEYVKSKNGLEYVFAEKDEMSYVHNIRFKINSLEEDKVNRNYEVGSPFVSYSPQVDNSETQIIIYNFIDNAKKKYPKNDYIYFDSGYNYYVLYNTRNEQLEYYNYNMKNIFSIAYDKRTSELDIDSNLISTYQDDLFSSGE